MKDRTILHVDCNSFFASVSLLYRPRIRHLPVAVGGDPETRHGIILAKNDLAKRFGVKTGSALWQAKQLCPNLVIIPPEYDRYKRFSDEIRAIFAEYTDMWEPYGSDESWLDVTASSGLFGDGFTIADTIRQRIKRELGITVSVGVSWNKIFAKLGSDMKKPDAITCITRENYQEKVWPLPVGELLFVGPATTKKLYSKGVFTIGELAKEHDQYLKDWFGVIGPRLKTYADGSETSPVGLIAPPLHSIGNSGVISHDVTDPVEVHRRFHILAESVGPRMREYGLAAKTINISVCDNDMGYQTRQCAIPIPTNLNIDLAEAGFALFQKAYRWHKPIRKLGLKGSNLVYDTDPFQCSFEQSAEHREQREKLEKSMDSLNKRWPHCVQRCITLIDQTSEQWAKKEEQREFTLPIGF